jgi:hypothetical protein
VSQDVWAWMNLARWPARGRVGGSTPGTVMPVARRMRTSSLRFLPGVIPTRFVGRALVASSVRVGSRGVVNHGPHVTASGCRHDDWQRGSERFFHPSPTKKRPGVEQARWADGAAGATAG